MANKRTVTVVIAKTFEDHKGRPGLVGGSLPKGVHHFGLPKPFEVPEFKTGREAEEWAKDNFKNKVIFFQFSVIPGTNVDYAGWEKIHPNATYEERQKAQESLIWVDPQSIRPVLESLGQNLRDYPEAFRHFNTLEIGDIFSSNNTYARAYRDSAIVLNAHWFGDGNYNKLMSSVSRLSGTAEDDFKHWWPPNCNNIKALIDHECGHIIDGYIGEFGWRDYSYTPTTLNKGTADSNTAYRMTSLLNLGRVDDTHDQFKSSNSRTPRVSIYSKRNNLEAFAETYTYLRNNPNAAANSVYADRIYRYLDWSLPKLADCHKQLYYNHNKMNLQPQWDDKGDRYYRWQLTTWSDQPIRIAGSSMIHHHIDTFLDAKQGQEVYDRDIKEFAKTMDSFGISKSNIFDWIINHGNKLIRDHEKNNF